VNRLRIVSHYPGRLRVRAKTFRDAGRGEQVAAQLRGETGITSASAVELTGSLLVEYDAQTVQLPWLVQLIVRVAGLDGLAADHHGGEPRFTGPAIRAALDRWNGTVVGATRGRIDARVAVPSAMAGLGVLRFVFGNRRLPEWYDLLFWSFVTFQNLNHAQAVHEDEGGEPSHS
jgi:hypothetical protein